MKLSILLAGAAALGLALASAANAQPADGGHGGGRGAVRQACAADIQKACPDAKPGRGGGMRECVVAHYDSFSQGCQAAITQMRAARGQQRDGGASPTPQ